MFILFVHKMNVDNETYNFSNQIKYLNLVLDTQTENKYYID